jgi:glycosyltransferase involved in cell wall biosynthesis
MAGTPYGHLRVALLCHYPDDDVAPAGGVWAVGRNLAAGLLAAGPEVHVVRYQAVSRGGPAAARAASSGRLTVHTVELPRQWRHPLRRWSAVPALAAVLQEIRPDAVTAHESEYGLAALRSGFPTAVTIHGIPRQEFRAFRRWRNRLDLALTLGQDWLMVRQVRHIVAINRYAMAQYRGRTRARFYRIDVPIGDVFFAAPDVEPDLHTLLLVGGMNERKDPLTLLEALALLRPRWPDLQLRVAGRVPGGAFGRRVEAVIQDRGLAQNVRFLGSLNQPALAEAYAASALTVLSSRQETSPAVLMEAMAGRRPVVATDVGGVREIVEEGETGLVVPPGDAPAMAGAIASFLEAPARAAAMGHRGRVLAEGRYRRDLVGRRYAALLDLLARQAGASWV